MNNTITLAISFDGEFANERECEEAAEQFAGDLIDMRVWMGDGRVLRATGAEALAEDGVAYQR